MPRVVLRTRVRTSTHVVYMSGPHQSFGIHGLLDQREDLKPPPTLGWLRCSRAKAPPIEEYRYRHIQAPASVDWRTSGVVGPVKNQHVGGAPCGCCWAFATIGCAALERGMTASILMRLCNWIREQVGYH